MTIITHNLGMSYLDDSQLIAELIHFEANIPVPYADSKGIASIGIGVNLRANGDNYLALVLDQLGVFTTYIGQVNAGRVAAGLPPLTAAESDPIYQSIVADFKAVISAHKIANDPTLGIPGIGHSTSEGELQAALNSKLQGYLNDPLVKFELSEDGSQAKAITKDIILGYTVGPYVDIGKQARLDTILHNSLEHNSKEYEAVMSLFYNGESQVKAGGPLATAIINGVRAEAWFDIRYGLNPHD